MSNEEEKQAKMEMLETCNGDVSKAMQAWDWVNASDKQPAPSRILNADLAEAVRILRNAVGKLMVQGGWDGETTEILRGAWSRTCGLVSPTGLKPVVVNNFSVLCGVADPAPGDSMAEGSKVSFEPGYSKEYLAGRATWETKTPEQVYDDIKSALASRPAGPTEEGLQAQFNADNAHLIPQLLKAGAKLCQDEGCDHHGTKHVCVDKVDAAGAKPPLAGYKTTST